MSLSVVYPELVHCESFVVLSRLDSSAKHELEVEDVFKVNLLYSI